MGHPLLLTAMPRVHEGDGGVCSLTNPRLLLEALVAFGSSNCLRHFTAHLQVGGSEGPTTASARVRGEG